MADETKQEKTEPKAEVQEAAAEQETEAQVKTKIENLTKKIDIEKNKGNNANQKQITALQSQIKPLQKTAKELRSRRLASTRVNKAIKSISLIENLAAGNYSYTDEQKEKIVMAISDAVVSVGNAFKTGKVLTEAFCI